MRDYNFQKCMAHEKRDDGCHSPAAVLQWIKGVQPEPKLVYQAFAAMCETRRLNKAGYARFRNFLLYGERNLARETVQVDIFQDYSRLTITRSGSHGALWNGSRTTTILLVLATRASMIIATSQHNENCGNQAKLNGL